MDQAHITLQHILLLFVGNGEIRPLQPRENIFDRFAQSRFYFFHRIECRPRTNARVVDFQFHVVTFRTVKQSGFGHGIIFCEFFGVVGIFRRVFDNANIEFDGQIGTLKRHTVQITKRLFGFRPIVQDRRRPRIHHVDIFLLAVRHAEIEIREEYVFHENTVFPFLQHDGCFVHNLNRVTMSVCIRELFYVVDLAKFLDRMEPVDFRADGFRHF